MIGVKITALLIVITVMYYFIMQALLAQESLQNRMNMALNNKYPKYCYVFVVLVVIDAFGILYSLIWFLFLR